MKSVLRALLVGAVLWAAYLVVTGGQTDGEKLAQARAGLVAESSLTAAPPSPRVTNNPTVQPPPTADGKQKAKRYFQTIESDMGSAAISLQSLSDASGEMTRNANLLLDAEWRAHVVLALAGMKAAGSRMREYRDVPEEASSLQAEIATIGSDLIYIADTTAQGIDKLDEAILQRALDRLASMNRRVSTASTHASKLKSDFGI